MRWRLVPIRRSRDDGWYKAWTVDGDAAEAIQSAEMFAADEDVPVMVMSCGAKGLRGEALGVFGPSGRLALKGRRR